MSVKTLKTPFTDREIAQVELYSAHGNGIRMVDPGTYVFRSTMPWLWALTDGLDEDNVGVNEVDAGDEVTVTLEPGDSPVVYYVKLSETLPSQMIPLRVVYDRPAPVDGVNGSNGSNGADGADGTSGGLFGSKTLVVSTTGDNIVAASDPYGAEFLTITAAMAAATAGDTVVVRPGSYTEAPGADTSIVKTGVRCLCFPGVTIALNNGHWASDGGGAGQMVHDLLGYPSIALLPGSVVLKRTGSGTCKGRYEIREITGTGAGFFNIGGAVDLDIDIQFDSAIYCDAGAAVVDGGLGLYAGLVHDNGSADSNISIRFRDATLTEAGGSEAGSRLFTIIRATTQFTAKGRRTVGCIESRGLSNLDIDHMDGGTSINAVLSTLRLAGGVCFLSCVDITQAAGNRGCINVSHGGAVLHFLRGRALGVSGGAEVGHAIIYTDGGVGINLYNGVVLIADAGDAASRCLIANPAVAPLAINAKVMGAIVANKAKDSGVTLTVGTITADTDVA